MSGGGRKGSFVNSILRSQLVGYTPRDRKLELAEISRLKGKTFEESQRYNKEMMQLLEQGIRHLHQRNNVSNNKIRFKGDIDYAIIHAVFGHEKEEFNELARSSVPQAKSMLFDRAAAIRRGINIVLDKLRKLENKRNVMQHEINYLDRYLADQYDLNLQTRITDVENSIQKARVRQETGFALNEKYRNILEQFEEEARQLPKRMDTIREALALNKSEVADCEALARQAHVDRNKCVLELQKMTEETGQSLRKRTIAFSETNKQLVHQATIFEQFKQRHMSVDYPIPSMSLAQFRDVEDTKMEILQYEALFESIKSGTLVPEVQVLVELLVNLDDILRDQKMRRSEMEKTLHELRQEKDTMQLKYKEIRYSGAELQTMRAKLVGELRDNVKQLQEEATEAKDRLVKHEDILITASKGVNSMMHRLAIVEIDDDPASNFVCDRLRYCALKLRKLTEDVEVQTQNTDFPKIMKCILFSETVDRMIPRMSEPIAKHDSLSDFDTRHDSSAPTREDIKKRSKLLIEQQQSRARAQTVVRHY